MPVMAEITWLLAITAQPLSPVFFSARFESTHSEGFQRLLNYPLQTSDLLEGDAENIIIIFRIYDDDYDDDMF